MYKKSRFIVSLFLALILLLQLVPVFAEEKEEEDIEFHLEIGPDWEVEKELRPEYARHFQILYYENGFKLIACSSGESYLYIPQEQELPEGLAEEIIPLQGDVEKIFLANTGAMSYFDELNALDSIRFSSLPEEDWFIPNARKAMAESDILFAGKYREPDYELLSAEDCRLCLFNTGIRKHDKVLTMLDNLDISYLIDLSSLENHPLAKLEWIKVYGALLNKEKEAEKIFNKQVEEVENVEKAEKTDLRVAMFSINKDGDVLTRKSDDYLVKMIEIAGAKFVLEDSSDFETKSAIVKLDMENFYLLAKDADIIIYNGMTDGHPESLDDVLEMNPLLEDFQAVKENRCYSIGKNFYQESSKIAEIISEFRFVFTEQEEKPEAEFIRKLEYK